MANNILKGEIKLTAPGVQQTANQVANSVSKIQSSAASVNSSLGKTDAAIKKTNTNFTGLSRILQDLPYGFNGIVNNIQQVVPAAGAAGLAISGITSALTFASVGFGAWTRGLGGLFDNKFTSQLEIIKDAIQDASEAVGKELVTLNVYKQKLNDLSIPASERVKILEQYNLVADKTNQIDAKQINNLELINQKIDTQNSLIVKRALSTAALSRLTEAANKLIENEVKLQEQLSAGGFKDLDDYQKKTKQAKEERQKLFEKDPNALLEQQNLNQVKKGLDGIITPANKAADAFNKDQLALEELIDTVVKGRGELQKLAGNLSGLVTIDGLTEPKKQGDSKKFAFLFDFLPFDPSGKLKPEQEKQVRDAAYKFSSEFADLFQGLPFRGIDIIKSANEFNEKLQQGTFKFKAPKVDIEADVNIIPKITEGVNESAQNLFIKAISDVERKGKPKVIIDPLTTQEIIDGAKSTFADLGAEIPKFINKTDYLGRKVKVPLGIDLTPDEARKGIAEATEAIVSDLEKMNDALENALEGTTIEFAAGIGDLLSGKGFENAFKNIANIMGSFLQDLGKLLIKQAIQVDIFKKAFGALLKNPALAIAAGIGMIAVGQVIKNTKLPQPKGFNRGGFVPGSGNTDTVPAMLTPGEFVVTKDKAPFVAALLKMFNTKVDLNSVFSKIFNPEKFNQGGFVGGRTLNISLPNIGNPSSNFNFSGLQPEVIKETTRHQISGSDLIVIIERQKRKLGRLS